VASPYEAEIRRAGERVLVDRMMWLATGAPDGQVRAIAFLKLGRAKASRRSTPCWHPASSASWMSFEWPIM